jgi:hypothetical protein
MKPSKEFSGQYTIARTGNEEHRYDIFPVNLDEIIDHPETWVERKSPNSLGRDGNTLYTRVYVYGTCPASMLKATHA